MSRIFKKTDKNTRVIASPNIGMHWADNQLRYLHSGALTEITEAKRKGDTRILIKEAPTGSGKSTVTCYKMLPEYIEQNQNDKIIFVSCFDRATVDSLYASVTEGIKLFYRGQSPVKIYNSDSLRSDRQSSTDDNEIHIYVISTASFNNLYAGFDPEDPEGFELEIPDLLIIDEVHREMASANKYDTAADFGVTRSAFDPKRLQTVINLSSHGMTVYGLTGTPSDSQRGLTTTGGQYFNFLEAMPKDWTFNKFTSYNISKSISPSETLKESLDCYKELYQSVMSDINSIQESVWSDLISIGIDKKAPRMIVKAGRSNTRRGRGVKFDAAVNYLRAAADVMRADFIAYSCDHVEYSFYDGDTKYNYIKNNKNGRPSLAKLKLSELINLANGRTSLLKPTIVVLMDAGNVGINLDGLSVVAYLSKPSQDSVVRTQIQTMSRSNRMPFRHRSHELQAFEMNKIECSNEQKFIFTEYVAKMSVSAVFVPNGSMNLALAEDVYCENTKSHCDGREYYHKTVIRDSPIAALQDMTARLRQKWVFDQTNSNNTARKSHCEACAHLGYAQGICHNSAPMIELLNLVLPKKISQEMFDDIPVPNQVDHFNGDRTDNSDANKMSTCMHFHYYKSFIMGDHHNKYDKNTGEKIS